MNVPEELRKKAALYEERNKMYGSNYKRFGPIMNEMLGEFSLKTASDHGRFGIFVQIVAKVTRYAENFNRGGHDDSLDDIAVYAMMLKELDHEARSTEIEKTDTLLKGLLSKCPHGYDNQNLCSSCNPD